MIDYIISGRSKKEGFHGDNYNKGFDSRKIKIDDGIHYCNNCNHTWSKVAAYVDSSRWRKFPEGNIPILGKKRIECPGCKTLRKGCNDNY